MKKLLVSILVLITIFVATFFITKPQIKENVTLEASDNSLTINDLVNKGSEKVAFKSGDEDLSLTKVQEKDVNLVYTHFFIPLEKTVTVKVVDTTSPVVTTKDVIKALGDVVVQDFIESVQDNTKVSHAFKNPIDDTKVTQEVIIVSTDEGNNSVENKANLTISIFKDKVTAELGQTQNLTKAYFLVSANEMDFQLPENLESLALGEHEIKINYRDQKYPVTLEIVDTTKPVATINSPVYRLGYDYIEMSDFVTKIEDASETKSSFISEPILEKPGEFTTKIIVEDSAQNKSEYEASYKVVEDTEGPVIQARNLEYYVGDNLNLNNQIKVTDNYDKNPTVTIDNSKINRTNAGTYPVSIQAKDKVGNTSSKTINITLKNKSVQPASTPSTSNTASTGNAQLDALVDNLLNGLTSLSMSKTEKLRAIYKFTTNYGYRSSAGTMDYYPTAIHAITYRSTNCYGTAYTIMAAAQRLGLPTYIVQNAARTHAWTKVNLGNGWTNIDGEYEYFMVSDNFLLTTAQQTHEAKWGPDIWKTN